MPVPDHTVEHIPAWNGKKEDKYVFSFLLAVFVIAALLMQWLYPKDKVTAEKIPHDIRQQLTALSNAAEEILLLTEMADQAPSLLELQEMAVPPFAKVPLNTMTQLHWSQPGQCFIGYGALSEASETSTSETTKSKTNNNRFFQLLLSFEPLLSVKAETARAELARAELARAESAHSATAHEHGHSPLFFIHWRLMDAKNNDQAESQTHALNCQQALAQTDWQASL